MNIGWYAVWYLCAYLVVTLIGIGHTIFNWKVLKMENDKTPVTSMVDITAYRATVPYHALRPLAPGSMWTAAVFLGLGWMLVTIVLDLVGWVLIRHPWRMSFKEMYVDYQPWLTLIYLAIAISPLIPVVLGVV